MVPTSSFDFFFFERDKVIEEGRDRERERGRERGAKKRRRNIFNMQVHSPNGLHSQGWARQKPKTRSFFQGFHMGARAEAAVPSAQVH